MQLSLAPCYRQLAQQERESLRADQAEQLRELESAWDAGALLAYLHLVDQRMRELGMSRTELGGRFQNVTLSAISKWFSECSISAKHLLVLQQQPEFRDLQPTEDEVELHGWRVALTWIRGEVLRDGKGNRPPTCEELYYLAAMHQVDEMDVEVVVSLLPAKLFCMFPRRDSPWLYRVRREWGRPYRLFVTEITR